MSGAVVVGVGVGFVVDCCVVCVGADVFDVVVVVVAVVVVGVGVCVAVVVAVGVGVVVVVVIDGVVVFRCCRCCCRCCWC